jgi:hypothetical protein
MVPFGVSVFRPPHSNNINLLSNVLQIYTPSVLRKEPKEEGALVRSPLSLLLSVPLYIRRQSL